MSDEADIAQARMDLEEEIRRKYTKQAYQEPVDSPICLNCDTDISALPGSRWCNTECREDWEKRNGR
jgi:hypothetical protein